jgi:hypothetical protein
VTRPLAALAVLALLAVLTACSPHPAPTTTPTPEDTAMTPFEAHDELDALLVAGEKVVGGTWRSTDGGAEFCTTSDGTKGAVFPFGRLGQGVPAAQQESVLSGVAATWTSAGFPATRSSLGSEGGSAVTQLRYPASGYGTDGIYLTFTVNENGSSFDAQSRCVPGDADKVNEQRQG